MNERVCRKQKQKSALFLDKPKSGYMVVDHSYIFFFIKGCNKLMDGYRWFHYCCLKSLVWKFHSITCSNNENSIEKTKDYYFPVKEIL